MGVHNLWQVLDEVGTDISLADLRGKKVAVDLSGWVMQSKTVAGLNLSKKPYLKILFYRTKALLTNGVLPIFVMEGRAPDCKGVAMKRRLKQTNPHAVGGDLSRSSFDVLLCECKELLNLLGVPCIRSSGEAESLCALLNLKGLVDGCVTEDNDAFLYGAKTILRGFTTQQSKDSSQLTSYAMNDIEQKLKLDRNKLIALALLLGCDYVEGVPGIGVATAVKLMNEMKAEDVLQRFRDWKQKNYSELFSSLNPELEGKVSHCTRCGHPGKQRDHKAAGCSFCNSQMTCYEPKMGESCSCEWHLNFARKEKMKNELKVYNTVKEMDIFPSEEVIAEYLSENNSLPDEKELTWTVPNMSDFQAKAYDWFGWPLEDTSKALLPIYTSWQILQICNGVSEADMDFLFSPKKIDRIQKVLGVKFYKVLWAPHDDIFNCDDDHDSETFSTLNDMEEFKKAYPSIVLEFEEEIQRVKALKEKEKKEKADKRKEKRKKAAVRKARTIKKGGEPSSAHTAKIYNFFSPVSAPSNKNPLPTSCGTDDDHEDDEPSPKKCSNTENVDL